MARSILTFIVCLVLSCVSRTNLSGQRISDIKYTIDVSLDDVNHRIKGNLELTFTNSTGKPLEEVFIHLYPNAYSSKETAFARQQLDHGKKDFYFAKPDEMGRIDSLNFQIDGSELPWRLEKLNPDIAILTPLQPIPPGHAVHLHTPFIVDIPISFSRLGHVNQSYQVTQWYPKLAMYDKDGWHPMPYLDLGEYYSEFGEFDVSVTVPENYIVAATGNLQDLAELEFLDSLSEVKNQPILQYPSSSAKMKKLTFKAQNVHDFAWFADKRFAVRKREVKLNNHTINCWVFYTATNQEKWESGPDYIEAALRFYSEHVGPYPYDNVTAVEAPLSKGGGMEYPMITLIGHEEDAVDLDRVITHEVGHNWFYGMIASNERRSAWMDEGMNYYFENRYILEKYGDLNEDYLIHLGKREAPISDNQLMLQYQSGINQLQPPATDPSETTYNNYFYGAYTKPAYGFLMLESYMGRDKFDVAVGKYYSEWSFKHPRPEDMQQIFEEECDCNLTWLFEDLMNETDLIDYKLDAYNPSGGQLRLSNKGIINAPVQIVGMKDGEQVVEKWIEGFTGAQYVEFDCPDCDKILLYNDEYTIDETPRNNTLRIEGAKTKRRKLRVTMLSGVPDPNYNMVNIIPLFGWNQYDKAMFGLNISNMYWPARNLEWSVTPLYATGSNNVTGLGALRYSIYPKARRAGSRVFKWELGIEAKSFHYNHDDHYNFDDRYIKLAPSIGVVLRPSSALAKIEHRISYRFIYVGQRYGKGINYDDFIWEWSTRDYQVNELSYEIQNKYVLAPYSLKLKLHQGKGFVRISADYKQKIAYRKNNKGLYIHAFAGWLPYFDSPDAVALFYFNGISSRGFFSKDFLYDELLFGRNEQENILSQQLFLKDAELKTLYNGGLTDDWMVSLGLSTDIPIPIPIQLYFDVAAYADPIEGGVAVSFSSGVAIVGIKDAFEIFIPVFESSDIRGSSVYEDRGFFKRITFLVDLNAANPRKLMKGLLD